MLTCSRLHLNTLTPEHMKLSTPGRICLFGEHQDYLGLPVIAMAMSVRCRLTGEKRADNQVIIHKPNLDETETFSLDDLEYTKQRDYFKSGIAVFVREGLTFSSGFECEITSDIPVQAGCGSSSAVLVSWIHFLSKLADEPADWNREKIGEIAYRAEVLEFGEPGGMMDQYSTALGKLVYLESELEVSITQLNSNLGAFVLGDSEEPKDTIGILSRCRDLRLSLFNKLTNKNPNSTIHTLEKSADLSDLNKEESELFHGSLENRDLLQDALTELEKDAIDHAKLGSLLTEHHTVLRDVLDVSTPKIESMMDAAMGAGALGGKINGSGGGGCMFAYAPENPENVADAIESAGGKAAVVRPDEGTLIH